MSVDFCRCFGVYMVVRTSENFEIIFLYKFICICEVAAITIVNTVKIGSFHGMTTFCNKSRLSQLQLFRLVMQRDSL